MTSHPAMVLYPEFDEVLGLFEPHLARDQDLSDDLAADYVKGRRKGRSHVHIMHWMQTRRWLTDWWVVPVIQPCYKLQVFHAFGFLASCFLVPLGTTHLLYRFLFRKGKV